MQHQKFSPSEAHFQALLSTLTDEEQQTYQRIRHIKCVNARVGDTFVIYEHKDGSPVELDRVVIRGFNLDAMDGVTVQLSSLIDDEELTVGFTPTRVFEFDAFMFVPLSPKMAWEWPHGGGRRATLSFPLLVRTQHRRDIYEEGAVYIETSRDFEWEVHQASKP